MNTNETFTAFSGFRRVAHGTLEEVGQMAKRSFDEQPEAQILIFSDETGRQVDIDLTETVEAISVQTARRSAGSGGAAPRGRGRPRLGVECSELCLLPRHWDWLAAQPRSASATIRRLIDAARKDGSPHDRLRSRIVAADKFLWALAGDLPNYEETSRALYAEDFGTVRSLAADWPDDVREHAFALLEAGGAAAADAADNGQA